MKDWFVSSCGVVRCLYCDALDLGVGLVRAYAVRSGRLRFLEFSSCDLFSALSVRRSASVLDFGIRSQARQVSCSRIALGGVWIRFWLFDSVLAWGLPASLGFGALQKSLRRSFLSISPPEHSPGPQLDLPLLVLAEAPVFRCVVGFAGPVRLCLTQTSIPPLDSLLPAHRFLEHVPILAGQVFSPRTGGFCSCKPAGTALQETRALSPGKIFPTCRLHCGSSVPLRDFVLCGRWPNRAKARCCLRWYHRQSAGQA
jgi:hypothetical protein